MASISHIPASEYAFEKDNRQIYISKISDDSAKKALISYGIFSQEDGFFYFLSTYDTPHDFLRAVFKIFCSLIKANCRGGASDPTPVPPTESSRKLGSQE